jgi:hypothetical protein
LRDQRANIGAIERGVVRPLIRPALEDADHVRLAGRRDELPVTVGIGLKEIGGAQQMLHELVASPGLGKDAAEQSIGHGGRLVPR